MRASPSQDEAARLKALHSLGLLDTPPEQDFDDFTLLAAALCGVPISLVSLIDEDRQWFKSKVGLEVDETPRDVAFCAHAIEQEGVFVVPDAAEDPRFCHNPLVTGDMAIRFYAGAPLVTPEGHALGTLCVIDRTPRTLTANQEAALSALARQVMARIQLRRELEERTRVERARQASEARKAAILQSALDCIITIDDQGRVVEWNPASEWTFGYPLEEAVGRELAELIVPPAFREAHRRGMAHYLVTGEGPVLGKRIEIMGMRAGGDEFPVELAITPVPLEGETLFTATLRDISERKAFETALRDQEEQYRLVFQNAMSGIYRTTPDGRILLANPALLAMLGYDSLEHLAARNLEADGAEAGYARTDFKARLEAEGEVRELEAIWERRDGRKIVVCESAYLVRDSHGTPLYYEGSIEDITVRKEAEEALRQAHDELERRVAERTSSLTAANLALEAEMAERQRAEKNYRSLFENAVEGVFQVTPGGRYLSVNPALATLYGYAAPQDLIESVTDTGRQLYVQPERRTEFIRRIQEQETLSGFESQVYRRNGSVIWISENARAVRDEAGALVRYEGTVEDITQKKASAEALRESEQRYRSLVDHSPEAVVVYSENRIVYANAAAAALFAAPAAEDLVGRLIFDFVHPDYHAKTAERARRSQDLGQPSALADHKYVRLDGQVIDVEAVSTGIVYQGRPAGQVLIRDVTDRKRAEEQLHASKDMLQLIMDNIPQLIFWKDADSVYLGCNRNFAQAAELSGPKAVVGLTDYDLPWPLESADGFRRDDRRIMDADKPDLHYIETQRLPDGSNSWAETNKIPLHDSAGRVVGILGTYENITDRKRSEEQIRTLNAELTQAYDATIEGWSRALDLRDQETEGHCRRVTELTIRLGRALGIGEDEMVHVRRGALLHDIGKMGVPDSVLLKPGPLTDDEWIVMRRHPGMARDMLWPVEFLRPALDIPYCHHEKWDGTGYPCGLSGEEIPLAARLFAIVDVWDALRSDRPYRKAWPVPRVLDHVRSLSGTHFDPQVVRLFLAMMEAEEERQIAPMLKLAA